MGICWIFWPLLTWRRTCNVNFKKVRLSHLIPLSWEDVLHFARIKPGEERARQSACSSHWGELQTDTPMQDERLERSLVHQSTREDEERREEKKRSRCCDLAARRWLGGIQEALRAQPPTRHAAPASNTHTHTHTKDRKHGSDPATAISVDRLIY